MRFITALIICPLILVATTELRGQPNAAKLPLNFLPIQPVYEGSSSIDMKCQVEYSEDGKHLIVWCKRGVNDYANYRGLYLHDIRGKTTREISVKEKGKAKLDPLPAGYEYKYLPRKKGGYTPEFNFHIDNRIYVSAGTNDAWSFDTTLKMFNPKEVGFRNLYSPETIGGQRVFLNAGQRQMQKATSLLVIEPNLLKRPVLSTRQQKGLKLADLVRKTTWPLIVGNSTATLALQIDNDIQLSRNLNPAPRNIDYEKTVIHVPEPKQGKRKQLASFFANHDKWFCIASSDQQRQDLQIQRWDAVTGQPLPRFDFPAKYAAAPFRGDMDRRVKLVRNGQLAIISFRDGAVILQVENGNFEILVDSKQVSDLERFSSGNNQGSMAFSPDGAEIALITPNAQQVSRVATLQVQSIRNLAKDAEDELDGFYRDPDTKTLADLTGNIPVAKILGSEPDQLKHVIDVNRPREVTFSSDQRWLFIETESGLTLFDTADHSTFVFEEHARKFPIFPGFQLQNWCLCPDASRMATVSDNQLTIWDMTRNKPVPLLSRPARDINPQNNRFGQQRQFMFFPSATGQRNGSNRFLLRDGSETQIVELNKDLLTLVAKSPDEVFVNQRGHLSFSADGKTIYAEALNGLVKTYQINAQQAFEPADQLLRINAWQDGASYQLFSYPFRFALIFLGGKQHIAEVNAAGQFAPAKLLPPMLKTLRYDESNNRFEGVINRQPLTLVVSDLRGRAQKAIIKKGEKWSGFDLIPGYVALSRRDENRVLIVKSQFEKCDLNQLAGAVPQVTAPVKPVVAPVVNAGVPAAVAGNLPPTGPIPAPTPSDRMEKLNRELGQLLQKLDKPAQQRAIQRFSKLFQERQSVSPNQPINPQVMQEQTIKILEQVIQEIRQEVVTP